MDNEQEPLLEEVIPDSTTVPKQDTNSPVLLLPALFLHILAFSQIINVTQQWLLLYICQENYGSSTITWEECRVLPNVQSATAKWEMTFALLANIPSLLSVPLLGKLSDSTGRKPIMLLPVM